MKEDETVLESLKRFQVERGLNKQPFDLRIATLNILEEILEMHGVGDNDDRGLASELYGIIMDMAGEAETGISLPGVTYKKSMIEDILDGLSDIQVFAGGEVGKLGYNNEKCLREVSKEINSRVGEMVEGKFIKFKTEEAMANWYRADFSNCKEP